ncbi:hypothetical protein SOVF_065610 [Spinacia oleracea]|nr:hypothetical protein SOVF_065610 [Spinacia oleracea]
MMIQNLKWIQIRLDKLLVILTNSLNLFLLNKSILLK